MIGVIIMSKEKAHYTQTEQDYGVAKSTAIYSTALESSGTKNLNQTNNLTEKNTKNKNNANISRTNLDTQLIDLNADGDCDESKYNDEI
jgi:hypothetical protein